MLGKSQEGQLPQIVLQCVIHPKVLLKNCEAKNTKTLLSVKKHKRKLNTNIKLRKSSVKLCGDRNDFFSRRTTKACYGEDDLQQHGVS